MHNSRMKYDVLSNSIKIVEKQGELPNEVHSLAYLPEEVEQGSLFIAVTEYLRYHQWIDGHTVIGEAIKAGAVAAVVEHFVPLPIPQIRVEDTRAALAQLSDAFYKQPFTGMKVIGVTGTNGKTTTSHLTAAICAAGGYNTGIIGTIGYYWGGVKHEAVYTTPLALGIRQLTAHMREVGVNLVSMEASSHAIKLDRIHGIPFSIGIFTNLTRDHLDFHGTMEDYKLTKQSFFQNLAAANPGAQAIINLDDPVAHDYINSSSVPVLTYSTQEKADVRILSYLPKVSGTEITLQLPDKTTLFLQSPLVGNFNMQNILAAVTAGWALQVPSDQIAEGVRRFNGVPGRFQKIDCGQDFLVIIDYAHTPDALERILTTAKHLTTGKLIAVFGCGGDRDRGKRPMMGGIAARIADVIVVTSDNPRTEDPESIVKEILTGIPTHVRYDAITDRHEAIKFALGIAQPGDIVVLAGKGHEDYQIIGVTKYPFSDEVEVRKFFK